LADKFSGNVAAKGHLQGVSEWGTHKADARKKKATPHRPASLASISESFSAS
jgi:hypothetical protein